MARTRICIRKLAWNLEKKILEAELESYVDQEVRISCPVLQYDACYYLKQGELRRIRI